MTALIDPLNHRVFLHRSTLRKHIYRRHPELRHKAKEIELTILDPDIIAKSKRDGESFLYFRHINGILMLMVATSPEKDHFVVRTSFYVFNTSKGDPIIWQKKIST